MNLLRLLRQTWNRLVASAHVRHGIRLYRAGQFAPAASHLHTAVHRAGPCFEAHLFLGRIYLRLNRFDRARQEFAQARFINPGRFSAVGVPEDLLLEIVQRLNERHFQAGIHTATSEHSEQYGRPRQPDDFSSPDERARFSALPPIRREDIEEVNWDELRSLLDD